MIYQGIDRWNSPDTYLEHYGVKGMKWGVRKFDPFAKHRRRKISKIANLAKKQADYSKESAKRLSGSKIGDFDDPEYFEIVSKREQSKALSRAAKLATQELQKSRYWDKAYKDILKSDSVKIAKNKFKSYKKTGYDLGYSYVLA